MQLAAIVLILGLLIPQAQPFTLSSSASAASVSPGDTITITIAADVAEDVMITQPIDQSRFEVLAVEPSDRRQLGHVSQVSYLGPGPASLVITLRVLSSAPPGIATFTASAHTADKIPVTASTAVRVGYVFYVP